MIDLHTHTSCSDGDYSPKDLIKLAADRGLTAMAITDHDTVKAYDLDDLITFAKNNNIQLIPGIEFSTIDEESGQKIHVVGLNININDNNLRKTCDILYEARRKVVLLTEEKLKKVGIVLRSQVLLNTSDIITKAHIAQDVLDNPVNEMIFKNVYGKTPLKGTFIEDYLIRDKPAFIDSKEKFYTSMAVETIKKAGGKAFCAHPSFNVMRKFDFESMKKLIIRNKFDGVEVINIQYDKSNDDKQFDMVKEFSDFAKDSKLLVSGGSDFHSDNYALWGNHSTLGLENEKYRITDRQLDKILNS